MKGIKRVKGAQSKPNPSPNAFPNLCEWFSGRFLLKGRGTRTVPSLREKSSWNFPNREIKRIKKGWIQKLFAITMNRNYYRKLWVEIIIENYQLVYQSRGKWEIYRDTGVSKNHMNDTLRIHNTGPNIPWYTEDPQHWS